VAGEPAPLRPLVVTSNYPSREQPTWGTFVSALVERWHAQGVPVEVVAPHPLWSPATRRLVLRAGDPAGADGPPVHRPVYASFSSRRVAGLRAARLTLWSFTRAALRGARACRHAPTLAYGHFLFPGGFAALRVARARGLPAVAALGEAQLEEWEDWLGFDAARATARALDGVVAVSEENRTHCVERYGVPPERILLAPNAVDTARFAPRDRAAARARLGLPGDRTLALFAGHFIGRKGPLRALAAVRSVPDLDAVFLGEGPQAPSGDRVLFAGGVAPGDVPSWLAAADVFVLPTLAEGSPNAILEAMACGLPVVANDIPALRETVDASCAVLVHPNDPAALREALAALAGDPDRRAAMGAAARERTLGRDLDARARRIAGFLRAVQEGRGG